VQIIVRGGDYLLALKGNQGTLEDEVEEAFIDADARDYRGVDSQVLEIVERGHGRSERTVGDLSGVPRSVLWEGMNMIGMVESRRQVKDNVSTESRFYIGGIGTDVACFARAARGHWGIEDALHWSLDVAFRVDDSRVREPAHCENPRTWRCCATSRSHGSNRSDTPSSVARTDA